MFLIPLLDNEKKEKKKETHKKNKNRTKKKERMKQTQKKNKFVFHFRYNWNSYGIAFESTVTNYRCVIQTVIAIGTYSLSVSLCSWSNLNQ